MSRRSRRPCRHALALAVLPALTVKRSPVRQWAMLPEPWHRGESPWVKLWGQLDPRQRDRGAWDAGARSSVPRSTTQGSEANEAAAEQQERSRLGHRQADDRCAAV